MFKLKTENLKLKTLLLAFALLTAALPAWAAPGDLDTGFGTGGKVTTAIGSVDDNAYALGIQSDGKIVAAGASYNGTNYDFALVRYETSGALDTTFGTGGKVTTAIGSGNDFVYALAIQSDGKIVAAGQSYNGSNDDFALVRYNTNGSLDTGFGTGGKVTTAIGSINDRAYALGIQSVDGKIVAAGASWNGTDYDFAIVRYNTGGTLDTSFDTDGKVTTAIGSGYDQARALGIQSDGKIVAAGNSFNGSNTDFALVRYETSGALDASFGTGGKVTTAIGSSDDNVYALGIQSGDGKIVAAGVSWNGSNWDFTLVRYNAGGTLDTSFDTDGKVTTAIGSGNDEAYALGIQSDGKIVAAGPSSNGSNTDFALVRYETNGALDTTFGTGGKVTTDIGSSSADLAFALGIQSDGKIVAAGYSLIGNNDFVVVRYLGDTVDTTGSVWTWGSNGWGELGDETNTNRNTPVHVLEPLGVDNLTNITAIAAGQNHTIALKSDGTVWTWGYNLYGQLGNGTNTHSNLPVQVKGLNGSGYLTGITAIAGGATHTIALKNDGTVWTWGLNTYGQLGNGTNTDSNTPVQVSGLTGITAIADGGAHTLALRNDGTVWTWGNNEFGQLGDWTNTNSNLPVQVKGQDGVGYLSGITAIAGGTWHNIALTNDGYVWTWGSNRSNLDSLGYGQLGDGTNVNRNTPVQVLGQDGVGYLSGITAIAGGAYHTIAVKNDGTNNGTVWTWGRNSFGRLGDGTDTDRWTPVQVLGLNGVGYLTDITAIAGGNGYTIAIKNNGTNNGTVWTWGYNLPGSLGDGTNSDSWTPVQVKGLNGVDYLTGVSAVASGVHAIALGSCNDCIAPTTTPSPAGGTYTSAQSVTLTPNETATTYYCLGSGCNPTTVGTSVSVTESTALRYYSKDTNNNSEAIKTTEYTIVAAGGNLANTGGDTATGGSDLFSGIRRIDSIGGSDTGDSDADNLDGGKATIDLAYRFELAVNDTAEPTSVKLYISDRPTPGTFLSNPEQWAVYTLTPASDCTGSGWTTGKVCSKDMKLGPAPAYKFYYEVATNASGLRYLPGGASPAPATGPVVKSLNGWAMLSVPRDIGSESSSALFGSGTAYRWVSSGLDSGSVFNGSYQGISTGAKEGEAYFVSGGSRVMPNALSTNLPGAVTMTLKVGWNIISNPYNKNILLSNTSAALDGTGWTDAVGTYINNTIYEYDGGQWGGTYGYTQLSPNQTLTPWLGYWVYIQSCPGTCILTLQKP